MRAGGREAASARIFLTPPTREAYFPRMLMPTIDGGIIDRKKPGRPRTHFPRGERRETMLVIAYAEIAEAQPTKLQTIIARADALRVAAKMRGDRGLQRDALAIIERGERRLAWFKRQEAKAKSVRTRLEARRRAFGSPTTLEM